MVDGLRVRIKGDGSGFVQQEAESGEMFRVSGFGFGILGLGLCRVWGCGFWVQSQLVNVDAQEGVGGSGFGCEDCGIVLVLQGQDYQVVVRCGMLGRVGCECGIRDLVQKDVEANDLKAARGIECVREYCQRLLRQLHLVAVWLQRLVFYCRTTSASTAPCTSRRMCCPTHCASYCACIELRCAFNAWS